MYGLKLYENYFKYLTSLNKNLINIYFVSIFSTNSAVNLKKPERISDFFFILLQISIMDFSFFVQITNIYLSVVKACHNFFLIQKGVV